MDADGAAIIFLSDVVDSTALTSRLGDAAMAGFWARHDALIRDRLAAGGGYEHDRTDGFLLVLDTVDGALRLAEALHAGLAALSEAYGVAIRSRVVIHRGPAATVATGARAGGAGRRLEGEGREAAEALLTCCAGGSTLVSAAAADGVAGLQAHGWWQVPGLATPVALWGQGAPPVGAVAVQRRGPGWAPVDASHLHLPEERDAFIGRAAALAEIAARCGEGARLITLLGPGGVGKSRLAVAAAWTGLSRWADGAVFCRLVEARDADGVLGAVGSALGVPLGAGDAASQLGHALRGRGRLLLLLDNAEQVADAVAALARSWLTAAPQLTALVTSRERLGVPGEAVVEVGPLGPDEGLALLRARGRVPDADEGQLAALLDATGGLPLAVELAAAWLGRVPLDVLVARLHAQDLPGTDAAPSLATTFARSWDLLPADERRAFARLSVFEGSFSFEAAEAVLGPDALDRILTLQDRALVRVDEQAERVSLLVPLRDFGRIKLQDEQGAEADAFAAHAAFYAGFGSEDALGALHGPDVVARFRALVVEVEQIVVACERAVAAGWAALAVRCALAAWAVFERRGPFPRGEAILARALDAEGLEDRARAEVLLCLTSARRLSTDFDRAEQSLARAEAVADRLGAPDLRIAAALGRGVINRVRGRFAEAEHAFQQAMCLVTPQAPLVLVGRLQDEMAKLAHDRGDQRAALQWIGLALDKYRSQRDLHAEGLALSLLGILQIPLGELRAGAEALTAARERLELLGDVAAQGIVLLRLCRLHQEQGARQQAIASLEQAVTLARSVGDVRTEAIGLSMMAVPLQSLGRYEEAMRVYLEALPLQEQASNTPLLATVHGNIGALAVDMGRLDLAETHLEIALAGQRALGRPGAEAVVHVNLGRLALARGAPERALDSLRRVAALSQRPALRGYARALAGLAHGCLGDRAAALDDLAAGEAELRHTGSVELQALVLCHKVEILLLCGLPTEAALAEAEAAAAALGAPPGSPVANALQGARRAVEAAR